MTAPTDPALPAPTIVKLGGSVITRKQGAARARPKVLARLAAELAADPDRPVVLLHGAGSFGHPGALKFGLARPPTEGGRSDRARGAAIVSAEVRRLHGLLLRALLDAGARPWSVPAAPLALSTAGELGPFDAGPFRAALARGLLPVAFGDVVPDTAWGFSILSADTIAVRLARELGCRRVLFVSDVDGVLKGPAANGHAPEIYARVDAAVLESLVPARGAPDVTGGIRGKIRAMLALADLGVDVGLISGLRHDALLRAVRGEQVYGSWSGPAAP